MDISQLIANVGVPTAVAFFVLVRLEDKLDKLADAMQNLADKVGK